MERNITITLEKAREWYNSDNTSLKEVALQAFSKEELTAFDFTKIKTFEDALAILQCSKYEKIHITEAINSISVHSKASAAMCKLNIIRKALNLGQDLHLVKNPKHSYGDYPYNYFPYNPLSAKYSTYFDVQINLGIMEIIGKIKNEGEEYYVLGGDALINNITNSDGLGSFCHSSAVCSALADLGFLGCATEEIAKHFGKYFGMLITEAKYADMVDFEIVENKYQ